MSLASERAWGEYALQGWQRLWLLLCHRVPVWLTWSRVVFWLRKPLKITLWQWVDVEVWGLKLRLFPRGNLSEQRVLLMPQYFDVLERQALAQALAAPQHRGGVFLDIGANIGAYSFWVASLASTDQSIRIEAFEPDPDLCERMHFNIANNQLTDTIHLHQVALSDSDQAETLYLQRCRDNLGQNQVSHHAKEGALAVQQQTLATFIRQAKLEKITALKIDTEGHEVEALISMFREIDSTVWPEVIICEIDRHLHDSKDLAVWQLLVDSGYTLRKRTRMNGIFYLGD